MSGSAAASSRVGRLTLSIGSIIGSHKYGLIGNEGEPTKEVQVGDLVRLNDSLWVVATGIGHSAVKIFLWENGRLLKHHVKYPSASKLELIKPAPTALGSKSIYDKEFLASIAEYLGEELEEPNLLSNFRKLSIEPTSNEVRYPHLNSARLNLRELLISADKPDFPKTKLKTVAEIVEQIADLPSPPAYESFDFSINDLAFSDMVEVVKLVSTYRAATIKKIDLSWNSLTPRSSTLISTLLALEPQYLDISGNLVLDDTDWIKSLYQPGANPPPLIWVRHISNPSWQDVVPPAFHEAVRSLHAAYDALDKQ